MTDVHSKETRSFNMSRIRSKDTKPELAVRNFLFANGFRYRLHDKKLPGKPDIVLPKYKTVIFVNGCFWHGHKNCKHFKLPKSSVNYWREKIKRNRNRDKSHIEELISLKWNVIVIWECKIKNKIIFKNIIKNVKSKKTAVYIY